MSLPSPSDNVPVSIRQLINENSDSLEISTPAKGGCIKCYSDFSRPDDFKQKLANAFEIRAYANKLLESQNI